MRGRGQAEERENRGCAERRVDIGEEVESWGEGGSEEGFM